MLGIVLIQVNFRDGTFGERTQEFAAYFETVVGGDLNKKNLLSSCLVLCSLLLQECMESKEYRIM